MKKRPAPEQPARPGPAPARVASTRKPLYQHVLDQIRDEILKGVYPVGSQLPTEEELTQRFGVSRHTIRESLRQLRNDGLVISRQRTGTTVARSSGKSVYIQEIQSISDLIQYAETIRYQIDHSELVMADAALAREIGGEPGQKWLRIEGVRYEEGNEQPVCKTVVYINSDYAGVGRLIGRRQGVIYELIEDFYGEVVSEVDQRVSAYRAPPETIKELHLDPDAVIVEVKRTYRMASKKIAEVAINQYPSDRFSLAMTLRRTAS